MTQPTSTEIVGALGDGDLRQRIAAIATREGVVDPQQWTTDRLGTIVTMQTAGGETIAGMHGYAASIRQQAIDAIPMPPGLDPAAVTDAAILEIVTAVKQLA